uniref:Uncharacterized protein n=1 Tax=Panagrolaimus davidi TaxID=227884 RepID=A0A914QE03_9BILA
MNSMNPLFSGGLNFYGGGRDTGEVGTVECGVGAKLGPVAANVGLNATGVDKKGEKAVSFGINFGLKPF